MKNFLTRTATAIVGIVLLYFILKYRGIYLSASLLILSLVGIFEMKKCLLKIDIKISDYLLYFFCIILFLIRTVPSFKIFYNFRNISILLVLLISFVENLDIDKNLDNAVFTLFSYIYIAVIFDLMYELNILYIVLIFIMAFATDTFAYLVGISIGRHKLIPKVSPKKSVEGAVGGIVGSVILGILWLNYNNFSYDFLTVIFLIFTSVSSQLGDLIASKIKRVTGIKDYGNIFPGHGGVLDRFDSILAVTVLIYLFSRVMEVI